MALRATEGDRRRAGGIRGQQDIDGVVRVGIAGVRKHGRFRAEHILIGKRGGEAGDAVALNNRAIGIEDHDAAVLIIWVDARHVIVGNRERRVCVVDEDAGGAPVRVVDVGDRIVVDRALRPGKGARRANLHAVLRLTSRYRARDRIVVDIDCQRRSVDEDAVLLEIGDGGMLDRDRMGAIAAMGEIVAGRDDRHVALGGAGRRAHDLVDIRDRDAVDAGIGIEHVDADKVVVRAIQEALLAPIDRHAIYGDICVTRDGDNGELVRPAAIVGIRGVDDQ